MILIFHTNILSSKQHQQLQMQQNANGANGPRLGPNGGPWIPNQSFEPPNAQGQRPPMGQVPGQPHLPQGNPMQSSPSLQHNQSQGNHLLNQGLVPPRTIPTPQQPPQSIPQHPGLFTNGMGAPSGPFASNNMQQQPQPPVGGAQPGKPGGSIPTFGALPPGAVPLDKARFENAFKGFCVKQNLKPDVRLLSIENRSPIDLHALHVHVMQEGGFAKVRLHFDLTAF